MPPTNPNADLFEISGYRLVYHHGACPRVYRAYKGHSMLGLVFEHLTHWSNCVDNIRYEQPLNTAFVFDVAEGIALDEFMQAAGVIRKANEERLGAAA
ncbi:hypothetical protein [Nostoc sp. FACHB-145]|uniref:hypothetical protein n=1 Tax=Nostoc sp. FACHB-145 TaxID=2692836 RepID=UPI0016868903|nr:hypothetical protein [Nostoc sp. FACHB-145]MBD2471419.1 hypothetical protein [Nostoc sp. FACHB-145]